MDPGPSISRSRTPESQIRPDLMVRNRLGQEDGDDRTTPGRSGHDRVEEPYTTAHCPVSLRFLPGPLLTQPPISNMIGEAFAEIH